MKFYVYVDNDYIGWVIAADEVTALELAEKKFPTCWGLYEVKLRKR